MSSRSAVTTSSSAKTVDPSRDLSLAPVLSRKCPQCGARLTGEGAFAPCTTAGCDELFCSAACEAATHACGRRCVRDVKAHRKQLIDSLMPSCSGATLLPVVRDGDVVFPLPGPYPPPVPHCLYDVSSDAEARAALPSLVVDPVTRRTTNYLVRADDLTRLMFTATPEQSSAYELVWKAARAYAQTARTIHQAKTTPTTTTTTVVPAAPSAAKR